MSAYDDIAASVVGPHPGSASASDTRPPQRVNGTGTTEATVGQPLNLGRMATLLVGATAVRFRLARGTGLTTQVATTDPIIPAYGRYDWLVEPETCCPYVEAADGASAYEAWAWTSSQAGK
jgi:hypothetical protein